MEKYRLFENYIPNDNSCTIYVRIHFNVWQKADGTGNWQNTPEQIDTLNQIVEWLNIHFLGSGNKQPSQPLPGYPHVSDTKIRFVHEVFFYQEADLYGSTNVLALQNFLKEHFPERLKGINIHIAYDPNNSGASANTASFNDNIDLRVLMRNRQTIPENVTRSPWAFTLLLAHELGHNFNLLHTYRPTPSPEPALPGDYDFLWDVFEIEGDNVYHCYDPYNGICYHNFGWNCDLEDEFSGCTNNLMGGTKSSGYKSPLQVGKMRKALHLRTTRKYAEGYNPIPYELSEDETWDFSIKFYQDLIIEEGATLTIKCDLQMVPEAKVIIKPGGKLIVDGGRIGTDFFSKAPWQGIVVEGDRNLPQTFENQGALILQNGAIIENATEAVRVRRVNDNWHGNGGIVKASDAQLINNWRNVAFYSYQNTNAHGEEINNISYFNNVEFITNDKTLHNQQKYNVSLWNVKGIKFNDCIFEDKRTAIDFHDHSSARTGIYTSNASFDVNNSSFTNMRYGIYASGSLADRNFRVYNSTFDSYRGIYFNALDNVILLGNTFNVQPGYEYSLDGNCDDTYGVYINNSSHFTIENNTFNSSSNGTAICGSLGKIARNTGSHTNELYRNDFNGFTLGIKAMGINRGRHPDQGLQLKCNRLDNGAWDFFVSYDEIDQVHSGSGIRELQGYESNHDPTTPAGNLFGNHSPILVSNFVNNVNPISYFHHSTEENPRIIPYEYSGNITFFEVDQEFDYSTSCPPRFHVNPFDVLVAEKQDAQTEYEETALLLEAYVDDGNTELMTQQVDMAGEGDAYYTYQYLVQTSPYLSEEVLSTLGAKEEGFNKAMIRDVMVLNPQAAKSEEVNLALDNRVDPLPAYMRWQINNGLYHFSEKEIMKHFMAYQKTRHNRALNRIITGILHEKDGFENAPSPVQLLADVDDIRYQYLRAEFKFADGDYSAGLQLLNEIEQQYNVGQGEAWQAHEEKTNFFTFLAQWDNDNHPGFTNLPENALQELENFLEATPRVAGKALSLLMLNDAIDYQEPIFYPEEDILPKTDPVSGPEDIIVPDMEREFRFSLYPNPARDYITMNWCIDSPQKAENGKIEIRNASGVRLHVHETRIPCNQKILLLTGWKTGTYTATLILDNNLRKTINFVIAR